MSVLFVCKGNVGRSQMAEAFYRDTHKNRDTTSASAGIVVEAQGQTISQQKHIPEIVDVMKSFGIDISQNKRTQLSRDFAEKFDVIIFMADKDDAPTYIQQNSRVEFWNIPDPKHKSKTEIYDIAELIRQSVNKIIA